MATLSNSFFYGLSGTMGGYVFSMRNGKQIIRKRPTRSKPLSPAQIAITDKFKSAAAYAKEAIKSPIIRSYYTKENDPGRTPYNNAMADFFHAPEIEAVITDHYTGMPGSTINILAQDSFKVHTVHISIINSKGRLVEEGEAETDSDSEGWIYTSRKKHKTLPGTKILVVATDLPGNSSRLEVTLP